MLKRIAIRGYKSLHNVEVHTSRLTVLCGPNSAGKSNFLDALQLLALITRSRNIAEAFDRTYRGTALESFTFVAPGIESLLQKDKARLTLEVDVELSDSVVRRIEQRIAEVRSDEKGERKRIRVRERLVRYRLELEINPKTGHISVADEYAAALKPDLTPKKSVVPFISNDGERLRLKMERNAHPYYFDRHLDYSILSSPLYAPYYPHLNALKLELSEWFIFYFEPREKMRALSPVREVRNIGLMGEDLAAFLNTVRAQNAAQFEAIEKALSTLIPSITGIQVELNRLGQVELYIDENGNRVPARLISEGTLRLLGLLALRGSPEPSALIGFEEPENGIHPRRIQLLAEYLLASFESDTTLIVTTHSPILLDYLPDASLYSVVRRDGATEITPFPDIAPLWKSSAIARALDDDLLPLTSERVLAGDFGG